MLRQSRCCPCWSRRRSTFRSCRRTTMIRPTTTSRRSSSSSSSAPVLRPSPWSYTRTARERARWSTPPSRRTHVLDAARGLELGARGRLEATELVVAVRAPRAGALTEGLRVAGIGAALVDLRHAGRLTSRRRDAAPARRRARRARRAARRTFAFRRRLARRERRAEDEGYRRLHERETTVLSRSAK